MLRFGKVLILTAACGGFLCTGARAQAAHQGTARVLAGDSSLGGPDTAVVGRRDFDVDVVRTRMPEGPTLMFLLYRVENGVLRRFSPFGAAQGAAFATATYAWDNDTTVVVTLRDGAGGRVAGFRIAGYRGQGHIQRLP